MLKIFKNVLTVAETIAETLAENVTEAVSDAAASGFNPGAFVENLKYMAAGMIGIFLVIGVIVLTIVLLGKLTASKKKEDDE